MNKLILLAALLMVGGLVWLGAGRATATRTAYSLTLQEANKNKILLLTVGSEPRTLDPQEAQGVTEHHIIMAMIEGLVAPSIDDQSKVVPGMADRWEHNEDYSVWTFHIGEDRKWSNGDPVTAQDFVFSYKRMLTSSFGAQYSENLFILKGAEDYYRGKITDFDQVGVKALDPHTLRIELVGPTPYLLSLVQHDSWLPVNPKAILSFGNIDTRDSKWTRAENYIANGPFKMKSWRPNDVIEVVRNPLYWDAANVKLNGINFFSIENLNTAERAFQAGQLHKTDQVPLDKVPYYRRTRPELIRIDPYEGVYFYRINIARKPLDNPKVRLALNLAVDRDAIVKNILREDQKPATGYTPPGMGDYQPLDKMQYDPERARQLLAEAGYPNGKGFPKFTIHFNTLESHRAIAEAIQQMWKEELNIDVGLENQEWKVYLDTQNNKNYDISRSAWIGDFMDPVTFLSMWTTGNGNNNTNWGNPKFDAFIEQAARTGDPKARLEILHQAEDLFLSEAPIVLVYWYTNAYLLQPSVQNWNPLVLGNHNYKYIDLKSQQEPIK
ncbi:MAG TPA: peptide ABC transporter substrate-binding protein [Chthoniobacterales bacterium]|jgi:oligopeptide transport system substrate-binding protein|nr:peptide ABC transporter substrate-binding protein [Chthoniobacterales bacterium]